MGFGGTNNNSVNRRAKIIYSDKLFLSLACWVGEKFKFSLAAAVWFSAGGVLSAIWVWVVCCAG